MKSYRTPGGYSNGGTGYPLDAPYASASGPVSENTGPDSAKTTPSKTSIERNASSKRRIMVPPSKIDGRGQKHLGSFIISPTKAHVRYWQILLLQESFCEVGLKFS